MDTTFHNSVQEQVPVPVPVPVPVTETDLGIEKIKDIHDVEYVKKAIKSTS